MISLSFLKSQGEITLLAQSSITVSETEYKPRHSGPWPTLSSILEYFCNIYTDTSYLFHSLWVNSVVVIILHIKNTSLCLTRMLRNLNLFTHSVRKKKVLNIRPRLECKHNIFVYLLDVCKINFLVVFALMNTIFLTLVYPSTFIIFLSCLWALSSHLYLRAFIFHLFFKYIY